MTFVGNIATPLTTRGYCCLNSYWLNAHEILGPMQIMCGYHGACLYCMLPGVLRYCWAGIIFCVQLAYVIVKI